MEIRSLQGGVLGLFQAKVLEPRLRSGGNTVVTAGDTSQTPEGYLLHIKLRQPVLSVLYTSSTQTWTQISDITHLLPSR
jgi:hypothetical protein